MEIKIRDARAEDIPFITSTWLNALWGSREYKSVKKTIFMKNHHDAIKKRMSNFMCLVACAKDDPYVIYGYVVYQAPNVIHFTYTKGDFRRFGICKKLIEQALNKKEKYVITHQTDYSKEIRNKYKLEFNPYEFYEAV